MSESVEVYELTTEQWDFICQKHLDKIGLTALELKQKHDDGRLSSEEFKLWMIVSASTLLD